MKKQTGFNLVELMVALAMSAILVTVITEASSTVEAAYIFTNNQQELNQNLQSAMSMLKRDIERSGVFGSFSFHAVPLKFSNINANLPLCSVTEFCNFDTSTLGIKSETSSGGSFTNFSSSISSEGITLASEVLRLQYGGDKIAYLNPLNHHGTSCNSSNSCTFDRCKNAASSYYNNYYLNMAYFTNFGVDTNSSVYMLSAVNHANLLNFASTPFVSDAYILTGEIEIDMGLDSWACPNSTTPRVEIESIVDSNSASYYNVVAYDPDMYTMQLMNFYTRYYFLGTKNGITSLYVKTLGTSGSLSNSQLISSRITNLRFNYKVDKTSNYLNNYPSTSSVYQVLSTSSMSSSYWTKVRAVIITLSGNSKQQVGSDADKLTMVESDAVSWL